MRLSCPSLYLAWCLLQTAVGLQPECSDDILDCYHSVDPDFAEATILNKNYGNLKHVPESRPLVDALCNPDLWAKALETCGACNNKLQVVDSNTLRPLCLRSFKMLPYFEDNYLHLAHPLNNMHLQIKTHAVDVSGCSAEHYPPLNGSIVFVPATAACSMHTKLKAIRDRGGTIVVVSSGQSIDAYGSSLGIEKLIIFTSVLPADAAVRVQRGAFYRVLTGFIEFTCPKHDGSTDLSQYHSDGCPFGVRSDMCVGHPQAYCTYCPLIVRSPRTKEQLACLYAPIFQPSRRYNMLSGSSVFPRDESVVLLSPLPSSEMCRTSDWEALAGKIVLLDDAMPANANRRHCPIMVSLYAAAEAGVRSVIVLSETRLEGRSEGMSMYIASTSSFLDAKAIADYVKREGSTWGSTGLPEGLLSFVLGTPDEDVPEPPRVRTLGSDLDDTPLGAEAAVVASYFVAGVAALALLWLGAKAFGESGAAPAPAVPPTEATGVPLGCGLALATAALFIVVAGVNFGLSYDAGMAGFDTLVSFSDEVVAISEEDKRLRSEQTLNSSMRHVLAAAVRSFCSNMELGGETAGTMGSVVATTDGDVAAFWSSFPTLTRIASGSAWRQEGKLWDFQLFTESGQYWDSRGNSGEGDPSGATDPGGWSPFSAVWTNGIPSRESRSMPGMHAHFLQASSRGAVQMQMFYAPSTRRGPWAQRLLGPVLSVVVPIYSPVSASVRGFAAASASVGEIQRVITKVLIDGRENAGFHSLTDLHAWFFDENGVVFMTTLDSSLWFKLEHRLFGEPTYKFHTVYTAPTVEVGAFAQYLNTTYGTLTPPQESFDTVTFNQADWMQVGNGVKPSLHITFDALRGDKLNSRDVQLPSPYRSNESFVWGAVEDSMGEWDVGVVGCEGGVSTCLVPGVVGQGLSFDGNTVVVLSPYLTTRVRHVRQTRSGACQNGADCEWSSTESLYQLVRPWQGIPDVIFDVENVLVPSSSGNNVDLSELAPVMRRRIDDSQDFSVSLYLRPDVAPGPEQWLFTDSSSKDATVRLYADGSLHIVLLHSGCRTPSVADQLPVGQWRHLVAVSSRSRKYCAVYIDGVEVSRGKMLSDSTPAQQPLESFLIGHQFAGTLDDLHVHHWALSGDNVQLLAAAKGSAVDYRVGSRDWVATFTSSRHVGACVSEDGVTSAIIGSTDVLTETLRREAHREVSLVQEQQADVESKLNQRFLAIHILNVVMLVLAVIVSLIASRLLAKPIVELVSLIASVAHMDVDDAEVPPASHLRELNAVVAATGVLLANMRSYKTFLPSSLFSGVSRTHCPVQQGSPVNAAPGASSGEAAIVFTDIQQASHIWKSCHGGMNHAMQLYNAAVREAIEEEDGHEVLTTGNSFVVAFGSVCQGIRFGLRLQVKLAKADWSAELLAMPLCRRDVTGDWAGLPVRVGVDYGDVETEYDAAMDRVNYTGITVNRAARTEAVCPPGVVAVPSRLLTQKDRQELEDTAREVSVGDFPLARGAAGTTRVSAFVPRNLPRRCSALHANPLLALSDDNRSPRSPYSRRHSLSRRSLSSSVGSRDSHPSLPPVSPERACAPEIVGFGPTMRAVRNVTAGHIVCVLGQKESGEEVTLAVNGALQSIVLWLHRTEGELIGVMGNAMTVAWGLGGTVHSAERSFHFAALSLSSSSEERYCGFSGGTAHVGYVGNKVSQQRFVSLVGPCVGVSTVLCHCAMELETPFLFGSLPNSVNPLDVPSLRPFVRPIDRIPVAPCGNALVLELSVHLLAGARGQMSHSLASVAQPTDNGKGSPAWSARYCCAFMDRDADALESIVSERVSHTGNRASLRPSVPAPEQNESNEGVYEDPDPVATKACQMLRSGTHLRPMVYL